MSDMPKTMDTANIDVSAFLRVAGHEIANPLNAISMNAELAKMLLESDQTPRAIEVLERLLIDCRRCARLTRSMQQFGSALKLQAREKIRVRELIDGAVALFMNERAGSFPEFDIHVAEENVVVSRAAMQRAVVVLLHNSAEAGSARIEISAKNEGQSLHMQIQDNGYGITGLVRSHALDPFYSTQREAGHSGLGLTLANALVSAHGGVLKIEESENGARISIGLPAALEASD
jgi:two-component system, OmpR family, sensor kinase